MQEEESALNLTRSFTTGPDGAIETSKLQEYIGTEFSDLATDIVVYNVLPCP